MTDAEADPAALSPTIALLQAHSLSGVVQREIERAILSGELAAGTRLNENALATKLGVSRGPIREACRALAELGLVRLVPNRGVFIQKMDQGDANEVYDLRAGLVGLAGRLLAVRVTDAQIDDLRTRLDEMERAAQSSDFQSFSDLNRDFHDAIVGATGNGRLLKSYRGLLKEFQLFRTHGGVEADSLMASNREHRAIVDALAARDPARSFEASFAHVSAGKQRTLAALARAAKETA